MTGLRCVILCNGHRCILCCEMQCLQCNLVIKSSSTLSFFCICPLVTIVILLPSFMQHLAEFTTCTGRTLGLCSFVSVSSLSFLAGFIFTFLPHSRPCLFRLLSFACEPSCFPYSDLHPVVHLTHACLIGPVGHIVAFALFRMYFTVTTRIFPIDSLTI